MGILVRLFQFVRPYWWATGGSLLLIFAVTSLRMLPAWYTKLVIDEAIPHHDYRAVAIYVGLFVLAAFAFNTLSAIETYLEQFVGQRVIYDLRNALYRHL